MTGLSVLAVDDEAPALDELTFLLENSALVRSVRSVQSATDALHYMHDEHYDVVLLDIAMPGLDGLEFARVLSRFSKPPAIVFVTAHEEHALEAFDAGGMGYLLKPVTLERLVSTLGRVAHRPATETSEEGGLETILVEIGSLTKIIAREDVSWVESAGDYVRLHLRLPAASTWSACRSRSSRSAGATTDSSGSIGATSSPCATSMSCAPRRATPWSGWGISTCP